MNIARITALSYIGLAVTGIGYYVGTRTAIYDVDDAARTLANITDKTSLAHADLALQVAVALFQAFTAACFYKLLRASNAAAAWVVGVCGMVNATIILLAAGAAGAGVAIATNSPLSSPADTEASVQLMYALGEHFWGVGSIFFGLWLLPMGWVAVSSPRAPKALGWTLIVAGIGYIVSTFVDYGINDAPAWIVGALAAPATIGEFWIIGYLLIHGALERGAPAEAANAVPNR